jgi:hypothetical protein
VYYRPFFIKNKNIKDVSYYYRQYLPASMLAVALAAGMGYENIYLVGFDLFSDEKRSNLYHYGKQFYSFTKAELYRNAGDG